MTIPSPGTFVRPLALILPLALEMILPMSEAQPIVTTVRPPVARVEPTKFEEHGHVRVDDYYWLRERENPEVRAYLEAENAYTEAVMDSDSTLRQALYDEIVGRIPRKETTVPFREGHWYYYERYDEGKEYPVYCRRRGTLAADEEVMLDVNAMAEGHDFYRVGPRRVSPDGRILAYPVDIHGRRIYTIHFKDLTTGETLDDVIPDVTGSMAWANDNRTLFYSKQDPVTLRWDRIYRHTLGSDAAADVIVYRETDETFECDVDRTKSGRYLRITSEQTLSTEVRVLDADDPEGEFRVIQPRQRGLEYHVDHLGDHFYIRTNLEAENFRLMRTPVDRTESENWEEVVPHRDDVLLEGVDLFRDFLVLSVRRDGLLRLIVRPASGGDDYEIAIDEPAYVIYTRDNREIDSSVLRFVYESMTTPESVFDYNMVTRERVLLKVQPVLGGFDQTKYETERVWAEARDGEKVPISLVYRKGMQRDGSSPLLLYGYGSYGYSMDAGFRPDRISLLDRGFVYAIAHIRGGQELGRRWYEDGKLLKKKNTFTDFIDCAAYLLREGYTRPDRLFAMGGSAGGLLMGAVANMRPDLFRGIVASVPFVDVVTTMLDASIPLTTGEYDEWGNPNEREYYDYMLSYSPYDQVEAKEYPAMLVLTALNDSQVQYWEPAKWVAKLRAMKTDDRPLLLETQMEAGHHGVSGRYRRYRETSLIYAFLLDLAGIPE